MTNVVGNTIARTHPRVAFVAGTLGVGGAERQLFHMATTLHDLGASPVVLSITHGEEWEVRLTERGIPVVHIGAHGSRPKRLIDLARAARAHDVEVLQSAHFFMNPYVATVGRALRIPTIGAVRSDGKSAIRSLGRAAPLALRLPDLICVNSNRAADQIRDFGTAPDRIVTFPNVIDADVFNSATFDPDAHPIHPESGPDRFRILAIGRLASVKRVDRLLDAIAIVRTELGPHSIPLVTIAGEGPLRSDLEAHATRLDLDDAVRFVGSTNDVRSLYASADLLVLTSESEGTPNVVLEAMASSVPVVSTEVGDVAEILDSSGAGIVCETTPAKIAEAIIGLARSPMERQSMGTAGANWIRLHRDISRLPDLLADLYASLPQKSAWPTPSRKSRSLPHQESSNGHRHDGGDTPSRLTVVSHKEAWPSGSSISGIATDGGFAIQMKALAELFDTAEICVPVLDAPRPVGEVPFDTRHMSIVALPPLPGSGLSRKLRYPIWFIRAARQIDRSVVSADLVHVPVPSDIGTAGILLALLRRKRLYIRYCGNWEKRPTRAEQVWRYFMKWRSGTTDLMIATGGSDHPPSPRHPRIQWLFSTSMTEEELNTIALPRTAPSPEDLVLVMASRQVSTKGTDTVIRALPRLREQFPGIRFEVVGDGPHLKASKSLAAELGVADLMRFHGKLDHHGVLDILQRAHIFVLPTESEGFPKAVVEALACGLPVVATSVSVIPKLISGAGVLIESGEPDLVIDAVTEIVSNPDRYLEMSLQARTTARGYTLEAWRDRIGELLGIPHP